MRNIAISSIIFACLVFCSSAVRINEIMYDPAGSDSGKEYVEVYLEDDNNGTTTNLDGWIIADTSSLDLLTGVYLADSAYALIVTSGSPFLGEEYANQEFSVYTCGATIGNGLGNTGDTIRLFSSDMTLMDEVSYDGTKAAGNNHSLEYLDGSWYESLTLGGTPGTENSLIAQDEDEDATGDENATGCEDDATADEDCEDSDDMLDSSDGLADDDGLDITGEKCSAGLAIQTDKIFFEEGEKVSFRLVPIEPGFQNVVEYHIESLSGVIVKKPYNTTSTSAKSWTASCNCGEQGFWIHARIAMTDDPDCSWDDLKNTSARSLIVVNCTFSPQEDEDISPAGSEKIFEENIEIEKINLGSDNAAKFGQMIRAKIDITKGDTAKTSVSVYAQDSHGDKISAVTSLNVHEKQSHIDVTLPVLLKQDCQKNNDIGPYQLIATGLGKSDQMRFIIDGWDMSNCQKQASAPSAADDKTDPVEADADGFSPSDPCAMDISSFYTLAKKHSANTRLFSYIKCEKNCSISLLQGDMQIKKRDIRNHSGRIDFNVSVADPITMFLLNLSCEDHSISRQLIVNFTDSFDSTLVKKPIYNKNVSYPSNSAGYGDEYGYDKRNESIDSLERQLDRLFVEIADGNLDNPNISASLASTWNDLEQNNQAYAAKGLSQKGLSHEITASATAEQPKESSDLQKNAGKKKADPTGSIAYESSSAKTGRLLFYMLGGVAILGGVLLLSKARDE